MFVNSDFSDLLRLFNANGVGYLVLDGCAVIAYAEPQDTKDPSLGRSREKVPRRTEDPDEQPRTRPRTENCPPDLTNC